MNTAQSHGPQIGRRTDVGRIRSANEDSMGDLPITDGHVLIVADGMGGYRGGAIASHLVIEAIEEYFRDATIEQPNKSLHQAICLANERIYMRGQQDEDLSRMGSTCVLAMVQKGVLFIGHVGDSRIYLLRKDERLKRITRDHTVVQHFVDVGLLREEEVEGHPDSHILSRALGPRAHVEPEVGEIQYSLHPGDRVLLCSDGLTKMMDEATIERHLAEELPVQDIADALVEDANERGGEDNVTVVIFEYHPTAKEQKQAVDETVELILPPLSSDDKASLEETLAAARAAAEAAQKSTSQLSEKANTEEEAKEDTDEMPNEGILD